MKRILLLACLCAAAPSFAQDQPASADSIREVMSLTKSKELMDGMYGQLDGIMQQSMQQTLAGKTVTAEQEKIMADLRAKLIEILREEMGWEKLEPTFIDIYQQSLTQKEVDGMIAFYKTDAGKAVIDKMPKIMQLTIELMMERMQKISPRVHELTNDMVVKLKAAK